jgi:hypothetical protein
MPREAGVRGGTKLDKLFEHARAPFLEEADELEQFFFSFWLVMRSLPSSTKTPVT